MRGAIRQWFDDTDKLLGLIRQIASFAHQGHLPGGAIATAADEEMNEEAIARMFAGVSAGRDEIARQLRSSHDELFKAISQQRAGLLELKERFELAYSQLGGDFAPTGFAGGRWAWNTIEELGYRICRWAREFAHEWHGLAIRPGLTRNALDRFEAKVADCPYSGLVDDEIRRRLTLEKSVMLRDAAAEPETPAEPSGRRRGPLPAEEAEALRTKLLAMLGDHPTLVDDPARVAQMLGISVSTARRWIDDIKERHQKQKRGDEYED